MRFTALLLLLVLVAVPVYGQPPQDVFQTSDSLGTALVMVFPHDDAYIFGQDVEMHFHLFNYTGTPYNNSNAICYFHLYDHDTDDHLLKKSLTLNGQYDYEITILAGNFTDIGEYAYVASCQDPGKTQGGYVAGYILLTPTGGQVHDDLSAVGWLILLPFLLAVILLVGAVTLNGEKHGAMRIGLFLLSMVPYFVSMWYGGLAVARFYEWPEMVEAIADGTFWIGVTFFVIVSYFIIYGIYTIIEHIRGEKKERLEY